MTDETRQDVPLERNEPTPPPGALYDVLAGAEALYQALKRTEPENVDQAEFDAAMNVCLQLEALVTAMGFAPLAAAEQIMSKLAQHSCDSATCYAQTAAVNVHMLSMARTFTERMLALIQIRAEADEARDAAWASPDGVAGESAEQAPAQPERESAPAPDWV